MLETIKNIDVDILLFVNGLYSEWLDGIMIFSSGKFTWLPLYIFLVGYIILTDKKKAWLPLLSIVLLITIADQFSSGLIKPMIERLRPCHEASLAPLLRLPVGCGGQYGFMSSHASNAFAVAIFLILVYKKKTFLLLLVWASLVSYSRMYLGVHYFTDIMAGAITGAAAGYMIYRLLLYSSNKLSLRTKAY
jgi:undecaprenyl-diphosphatase